MGWENAKFWSVFGTEYFNGWDRGNLMSMGQTYSKFRPSCNFCDSEDLVKKSKSKKIAGETVEQADSFNYLGSAA